MNIELSKSELATIKEGLRFLIYHITDYDHTLGGALDYEKSYKTKKSSLAPFQEVLNKLPDLRNIK